MSDTRVQLTSPRFRDNQRLQQAANNSPPMRIGEQGQAVQLVQTALIELGFPLPISTKQSTREPDGVLGSETRDAVIQFQTQQGLVDDGIVGMNTLERLDELFHMYTLPEVLIIGKTCPTEEGAPATTFDDYIHLVSCAEQALPQLSSRSMLSLLRQLYFGRAPLASSPDAFWADVIPGEIVFDNPDPMLANPSVKMLKKSKILSYTQNIDGKQVTNQIDIGHVFAGLEAMTCPMPTVALRIKSVSVKTVAISNEEFATWVGDLGQAVAGKAVDDTILLQTHPWDKYFDKGGEASSTDLEGDIDSYVLRKALLNQNCEDSSLLQLDQQHLPQSISKMLEEYYLSGITELGNARKSRFNCFARAIGCITDAGTIVNKTNMIARVAQKTLAFARVYFVIPFRRRADIKHMIDLMEVYDKLPIYSEELARLFIDWVEERLSIEDPPYCGFSQMESDATVFQLRGDPAPALSNAISLNPPAPLVQPMVRLLSQWVDPWGPKFMRGVGQRNVSAYPSGKDNWSANGCYPTCVAMVLRWWAEDNPETKSLLTFPSPPQQATLDPPESCQRLFGAPYVPAVKDAKGEFAVDASSIQQAVRKIKRDGGSSQLAASMVFLRLQLIGPLELRQITLKWWIQFGPVIALMSIPGHFVVIDGYRDNKIYICDPGNVVVNSKHWKTMPHLRSGSELPPGEKSNPGYITIDGAQSYQAVKVKFNSPWLMQISCIDVAFFDPLNIHPTWSDPNVTR